MNSSSRRNSENTNAIHSCFGWSRHCAVYTFVLAISTSIFVTCMILSVYLTYKESMDKIVVVLIVGSCLLYLLGFSGNMYSIYYCRQNEMPSSNGGNSNKINNTNDVSAQSSFTSRQPPDVACFPHLRELPRKTPPPPYEVQMSEMSRMLLPDTSRTIDSSTRELEIAEEARKLIQRIYEEIRRTDQKMPQSPTKAQSEQQLKQMPKSAMRQQESILPNASHQNLVAQRQQTDVKGIHASSALPLVDSRTNQFIQQKAALYSSSNQFDMERFITGSEGCIADLPQPSPKREDFLQVARKRKLISPPKALQTRPKIKGNITHVGDDSDSENKAYEEIELVGNNQNTNSSAYESLEYYRLESKFENPSEQVSSVGSATSELGPSGRRRKNRNSSVKARRQLSATSTKKFRQLAHSPETVLDAIATCFDLTPDEWMAAWKLSHKGVAPRERAKILGVRLHGDSCNDDN